MNIFRRIMATVLCSAMVVGVVIVAVNHQIDEKQQYVEYSDSVIIWYTDEAMTDYLSACAVAFNKKYDIRVIPQYHTGLNYIEDIYDASVRGKQKPDLFIVSNDALEKAYLSGVASQIQDSSALVNENHFPVAAMNAVSYHGDVVAYPYYFETSVLLFNQSYMKESAKNLIIAEKTDDDMETDESADNTVTTSVEAEDISEEEIVAKVEEMLPTTFEELLNFADHYDAPGNVESVFKWDVADVFYNYFFVGNYLNLGGPCGDDPEQMDVYNMDAIKAMQVYQDLNQFFSFETEGLSYQSVIDEFIQGKLVMTTATSDVIKKLEEAQKDGSFNYEYALTEIPDLNDTMQTKSMSVTNTIAINGYSDKRDKADQFAKYLLEEAAGLYEKTGKLPCESALGNSDEKIAVFYKEYAQSAPVPKMMVTSNFWVELEIMFSEIWSGKPVSVCMKDFAEMMMEQITGAETELEYIEPPKEEEETMEYLDEEAAKEAAKKEE